ncbi:LOW QUALITY PROTEIN: rho GTPase-activating protein 8 [Physeter macrocephalus]|uniref:LOW QUALITY PROTEIN: rho GTPase-activating protein 8 n=1 Tax=Physeter macrocephalus TaxID=9755 RepID=A0A455BES6_PHYMC|nr:LOW QUALITY PROTEIN: rho GTPase-activating protein 8 [Physeter catodon]|eukprot:XP_028347274.1 LOW QUALITY PROTEIN: rho GTPase-activating protein 8 [Physeter catodon]
MGGPAPVLSMNYPFYDVARHGILQVAGESRLGRRVVALCRCRMPASRELNHRRLLRYSKYTLDQYVESAYTVVCFHYGLNSQNKPSLGWLQSACREFDRRCKKNLKALWFAHPTSFIQVQWNILKPLLSFLGGGAVEVRGLPRQGSEPFLIPESLAVWSQERRSGLGVLGLPCLLAVTWLPTRALESFTESGRRSERAQWLSTAHPPPDTDALEAGLTNPPRARVGISSMGCEEALLWGEPVPAVRPPVGSGLQRFGKKVTYFSYLSELREHLRYDQLIIAPEVLRYDEELRNLHLGRLPPPTKTALPRPPLPTQQFGVSLRYARDGECSGAQRRGAFAENSHAARKEVGAQAQPRDSLSTAPHPCPPSEGRRKSGLRKAPHAVAGVESSLRVTRCRQILQSLPEHSYAVLSYLMGFLHEVSRESIFNKMNSSNLACVFGLNLIWPSQGASSLSALVSLNPFTELLIECYGKVFSGLEVRGAQAGEQGSPCARDSAPDGRPRDRPTTGLARSPVPSVP